MSFDWVKAHNYLIEYDDLVARMTVKSKQLQDLWQYEPIRRNIALWATSVFGLPVEVNLFGSRIIGVATDESDLDIYVCIDKKVYQMYSKSSEQHDRLKKLKKILQSSRSWKIKGDRGSSLYSAVPVLFALCKPMNLDCDINITNGVGNRNSRLIAHLFDIQPEAVSLVHFVRMWLKMQGFNHLRGYTITLLVLFFLQSRNLMPSGEVVQRNVRKEIIDGWEVQFDPNRSLFDYSTDKMISYKHHVKGFFQFFKEFDYSNVMSTFDGKPTPDWVYKERFEMFRFKGIYIAGPVNRGMNCGIIEDHYGFDFIELCIASHEFLKYFLLS